LNLRVTLGQVPPAKTEPLLSKRGADVVKYWSPGGTNILVHQSCAVTIYRKR